MSVDAIVLSFFFIPAIISGIMYLREVYKNNKNK